MWMRRVPLITLTMATALAVSFMTNCSSAPKDTRAADETAIRAASAGWSAAAQAKDIDKSMAYYTDDAIQASQDAPVIQGKAALRDGWQKMFQFDGPGLSFTTQTVNVAKSGDLATEYGTYLLETADKNGKFTDQKGKYLVVWKKQADSSWKATMEMANSDAPPPAPVPAAAPVKKHAAKAAKKKHGRHRH
jgi:ketosteroid isomerase-like protein